MDNRGSIPWRDNYGIFSSPPFPDWFCAPPTLLSNGYRGRGVKLTSHHLVPRSYTSAPPIHLHGVIIKHNEKELSYFKASLYVSEIPAC
jgi:hypothetical protein